PGKGHRDGGASCGNPTMDLVRPDSTSARPGRMASSPVIDPEVDETICSDRRFSGHPLGVGNLAGVEMWERFSSYGMQAILAFYLYYSVTRGGLALDEAAATSIVGAYGGLVYLSAILGA